MEIKKENEDISMLDEYADFFHVLIAYSEKWDLNVLNVKKNTCLEYYIENNTVYIDSRKDIDMVATLNFEILGKKEYINIPNIVHIQSHYSQTKLRFKNLNCNTLIFENASFNNLSIEKCNIECIKVENDFQAKILELDIPNLKNIEFNKRMNIKQLDLLKTSLENFNCFNCKTVRILDHSFKEVNIDCEKLILRNTKTKQINSIKLKELKINNVSDLKEIKNLPNLIKLETCLCDLSAVYNCPNLKIINCISNKDNNLMIDNKIINHLIEYVLYSDPEQKNKAKLLITYLDNNLKLKTNQSISIDNKNDLIFNKNNKNLILFNYKNSEFYHKESELKILNVFLHYFYKKDETEKNIIRKQTGYDFFHTGLKKIIEKLNSNPLMEKLLYNKYQDINLEMLNKFYKQKDLLENNFVAYICTNEALKHLFNLNHKIFIYKDHENIIPQLRSTFEYNYIRKLYKYRYLKNNRKDVYILPKTIKKNV